MKTNLFADSQCKVASIDTSQLEAHFKFYRLFMKGKFDVCLLQRLKKSWFSQIVTHVNACNFTVCQLTIRWQTIQASVSVACHSVQLAIDPAMFKKQTTGTKSLLPYH